MSNSKLLLKSIEDQIPVKIPEELLVSILLDISRVLDSKITNYINRVKEENGITFNSHEKNQFRKFLLGLNQNLKYSALCKSKFEVTEDDLVNGFSHIINGLQIDNASLVGTIVSRYHLLSKSNEHLHSPYLDIIKRTEEDLNQLLILHLNPDPMKTESEFLKYVFSSISQEYDKLTNYHYLGIIFEDNGAANFNWSTIYRTAIFCENFLLETEFNAFNRHRRDRINELESFLNSNENLVVNDQIGNEIRKFYSGVSYGFKFQDLFISDNSKTKVLVMQKVQLDETDLYCPDCLEKIVTGNSYPQLLYKSFECINPKCPSRSKSGRGKRFDYLSVKRNLMLTLDSSGDYVDYKLYRDFRRDVYSSGSNEIEMIIKFFSWHKNNVVIVTNVEKSSLDAYGRQIIIKNLSDYDSIHPSFEELRIVKLFSSIASAISINESQPISERKFNDLAYAYNGNSTTIIGGLPIKLSGVITSPPYYNAREYSNWPTFLCYLVDMMISATSIYNKMDTGAHYFYNVGDIVDQDNIYIKSQMSKGRIMLGFYSSLVFEIAGFKLQDNVIWDKGEVQSKRNSTVNLFPGYIKPINCYEHILIFTKGSNPINIEPKILVLGAVKKINSKGENTLGHTAPYPEELVKLIFPYLSKNDGYLLDPFLGSGTTVISAMSDNKKSIGIELDTTYFNLACNRIESSTHRVMGSISGEHFAQVQLDLEKPVE